MRRLAACALALLVLAGCRDNTVTVAFRPTVGATYRYEIRVHSISTTTIDGARPERREEEVRLVAEHTVLDAGPGGVRVRVLVGEPGAAAQAFVVRFDRAAQLQSIESVEGEPADIVGVLGVPEIFPGAAGAPLRPLAPGDEWHVSRRVRVPGTDGVSHLRTEGRLVELGVSGDEKIARLASTTVLPLRATTPSDDGTLELDGRERIEQRATYDLDDGAVRRAEATTTGRFRFEVDPPTGTAAPPVTGLLELDVTSTTRRL